MEKEKCTLFSNTIHYGWLHFISSCGVCVCVRGGKEKKLLINITIIFFFALLWILMDFISPTKTP